MRTHLPGELDLQLPGVVTDLDLELEVHLVGHVHGELEIAALELDLVVACERVRDGVKASRSLLAAQPRPLGQLDELHSDLPTSTPDASCRNRPAWSLGSL